MDNESNERLLGAWLKLCSAIWSNRILSDILSYNEAFVCKLLFDRKKANPSKPYLPIKNLCEYTGLLKSQMNKTLNDLEKRNYIERHRFDTDRRMVYVSLSLSGEKAYLESHENTMKFVNEVSQIMGKELVLSATSSFEEVAEIVNKVIENKGR